MQLQAVEVSLPDVSSTEGHPVTITLPVHRCTPPVVERLREILATHPGVSDVHLKLTQPGRATVMRLEEGEALVSVERVAADSGEDEPEIE